jgi:hypothetical protein
MASPSGDPIPTITEAEATGTVEAIYREIRESLNISVVNLIWRHFATLPGCLEWGWAVLKPGYVSGDVARAADTLCNRLDMPAVPPVSHAALRVIGISAADEDVIRAMLDTYNRGNSMNLLALSALLAYLDSIEGGAAAQPVLVDNGKAPAPTTPLPQPDLPPLLSLSEMAPATAELVRELNLIADRTEGRMMASLYRHLAHWPGCLALFSPVLLSLQASGWLDTVIEDTRAAARARSQLMIAGIHAAADIPLPDAAPRAAMATVVRDFTANLIPKMLPIGTLMLRLMPARESTG